MTISKVIKIYKFDEPQNDFVFGNLDHMKNGWTPKSKYAMNIMSGDTMLSKDFKAFIELLNRHKVR